MIVSAEQGLCVVPFAKNEDVSDTSLLNVSCLDNLDNTSKYTTKRATGQVKSDFVFRNHLSDNVYYQQVRIRNRILK